MALVDPAAVVAAAQKESGGAVQQQPMAAMAVAAPVAALAATAEQVKQSAIMKLEQTAVTAEMATQDRQGFTRSHQGKISQ